MVKTEGDCLSCIVMGKPDSTCVVLMIPLIVGGTTGNTEKKKCQKKLGNKTSENNSKTGKENNDRFYQSHGTACIWTR